MRNPKQPLISIREAATMCGVSPWTMHVWINRGFIPVTRFPTQAGGNPRSLRGARLDPADVERFIAQHKTRVGVFD